MRRATKRSGISEKRKRKKSKSMNTHLILVILFCLTTMADSDASSFRGSQTENVDFLLTDKIFKLPRTLREGQHLHKLKGKKANISIFIASRPSADDPYYKFQVGYINEIRFEIYDNYRLNKKFIHEKNIEIFDVSGQYIPLKEYKY
jgi:hypothetical protein